MAYLDEKVVLKFYADALAKDEINFLKGKEDLKKRITEQIESLLKAKEMHDKIMIAKGLWKLLFEGAMSYIDPDKRGYDDIFAYFDEYVDFEELIFASDAFYRDHTLHCLWVYFLGEYVRRNDDYQTILVDEYKEMLTVLEKPAQSIMQSQYRDIFKDFIYIVDVAQKVVNNREAVWCITALTHDLGYPIKKIEKINKAIQKILPYFQVKKYDVFDFSYTNIQQNFINDFIDLMCYEVRLDFSLEAKDESLAKIINEVFNINEDGTFFIDNEALTRLSEGERHRIKRHIGQNTNIEIKMNKTKRMSFSHDFEHYEHGIMSAYLLMKTIHSFNTLRFSYNDFKAIGKEDLDAVKFASIEEILAAVSNHTSSKYQIKNISSMADFLILIDELEEFSRISRAAQQRQFIEEFCKTELSFTDGWFCVDFTFDNENVEALNPEFAFKGRCNRFLTLFDIPNLDEKLKIRLRCIDKIAGNNDIYTLELATKYANILINGKEQNIPQYLKSNIFYSKEEYMAL